ncbi:hypothetical protein EVA_01720 [gut metagenome]|uniref:Uncharacterized protein n=1 Tax=gut metagenome TaxID=749906 RepID=J9DBA4_9ZZZZ
MILNGGLCRVAELHFATVGGNHAELFGKVVVNDLLLRLLVVVEYRVAHLVVELQLGHSLAHLAVRLLAVAPLNVAKDEVEVVDNAVERFEVRVLASAARFAYGNRVNAGILVGQLDALFFALHHPVFVEVHEFEQSLGEVLLANLGQLT